MRPNLANNIVFGTPFESLPYNVRSAHEEYAVWNGP